MLVDEIGDGDGLRFRIVNHDEEIAGTHEFVDNAVDGGEELLEILGSAGFLGNAIESRAECFGTLAPGNIGMVSM